MAMGERFQVTELKPVGAGKNLCTIFIEDVSVLSEIPEELSRTFSIGSTAYTASFAIFTLQSNGWVDRTGMVVSV